MNASQKIKNNTIEITMDKEGIKMIKGFTVKSRMMEQFNKLRDVLIN